MCKHAIECHVYSVLFLFYLSHYLKCIFTMLFVVTVSIPVHHWYSHKELALKLLI